MKGEHVYATKQTGWRFNTIRIVLFEKDGFIDTGKRLDYTEGKISTYLEEI